MLSFAGRLSVMVATAPATSNLSSSGRLGNESVTFLLSFESNQMLLQPVQVGISLRSLPHRDLHR